VFAGVAVVVVWKTLLWQNSTLVLTLRLVVFGVGICDGDHDNSKS